MRTKQLFLILALLCAMVQGTWAQANWNEVYKLTHTTSSDWTALTSGSTTGYTLGSTGTTKYYYVNSDLTFSNSSTGGSGLTIRGTVYLYVPEGKTITCKGANANGTTGAGAGIELTSDNTLYLIGTGTVKATGGNAANGGNGSTGRNAYSDYDYYICVGGGGAGGNGGGGAGAGIGTRGGTGGAGGAEGSDDMLYDNRYQNGKDGAAGSAGGTAGAIGKLYVANVLTVNATGGNAGTSGGSGGQRGRGCIWDAVTNWCAAGGGGGGGGGFGGAAVGIGTGGPGGGGGGAGATGASNGKSSGCYDVTAGGGKGGKNGDGSDAGSGADAPTTGSAYSGGWVDSDYNWDSDDFNASNNAVSMGSGGSGGAAGAASTSNNGTTITIVNSETTTMSSGINVVLTDVTIPSRITVSGTVELNLAEGTTLHAPKGIDVNRYSYLTINGPGTLTIDNCDSHKSGIGAEYVGTIIINSGTVNVHGGGGAAGIGGDYHNQDNNYYITINGGVVNAYGSDGSAGIGGGMGRGNENETDRWGVCGFITINGGQVTAVGGEEGPGIGPGSRYLCSNSGKLTLGWTNLEDFVYCSTYYSDSESPYKATLSSITFAEGKQLMIEGTGVVSTTASVISGKKLVPFVSGQSALTGAGTQANPWRISSSADWMKFMLNVVNGNSYSGEYVQLDADIDISSGIGGKDNYPFSGTFLGNNHTLNVSLTGYYEGTAPFIYISDATIKNLKVTGYITSGEHHTSGLVGFADGANLIEGCTVSATLDLHRDYASGFVGHGLTSATTIKDCLFDGQFVGSEFVDVWYENGVTSYSNPHYPNNIGVFWGWSIEGTPTLKNCMEKGIYTSIVSMHPMGLMGETGSIASPCYYVNPQIGSPSKACTHSGAYQVYTVDTTEGEMLRPLQLLDGITYYTPCVITNIDAYYQRTGNSVSVTPLVTASDGTPLDLGTNYTATLDGEAVTSYPMDFSALGTKVFTVTGLGNCKGSKSTSFIVSGFDGEGTADSPYIISSEDQWVAFASEVNHGNDCSGKYLKLTADISTTTRCGVVSGGTQEYAFSGTFDGNGHTITITITDNENQGNALFHYINGATIRNLTTAGTIITNQSHSSGLVGFANGTNLIEGCTVTTTIDITCNYAAGFVGHGMSSVTTIRNCVFAGQFIGRNYYHNSGYGNPSYPAGFWGWGDNATVALENCVDIGTYNNVGSMHPMGHLGSNTTGTLTNCYYQNILPSNPLRGWTVTANSAFGKVGTSPSDTEIYKQITINSTTVYSLGCAYDISELYGINEPITPGLIEPLNGKALAFGTDYTVTLDGNSVAALPFSFSTMGSHTLEVSGTGNYSGSKSFTFSVVDIVLTGRGTEENPFCIGSADDWDTFVGFVNGGNSYRGKYVKLMDNISVTQKCGTVGSRAFSGTFLGNGKTISATISVNSDGTALFCYINDATIQNLKVTGSISSSQSYVSGLVGIAEGTNLIKDCAVTAQILNPSTYGTYAGGFVGRDNSRATTIEGCVFAGSITGYGRTHPGSYWGVSLNVSSAVVNCLDHGYYKGCKNFSGSFGIRINGSSQVYSITPDKGVSLANGRAAVAEYNVSGLTIYETGLKYNDVLYAAEGDAISLIIGSMSGYTTSDYTASGGTLTGTENPFTLTMPASNVTINAAQCTPNTLPTDVNGTYVINSTNDWDIFCANVESGNSFSGETVKLMDDISVSTMAGSSETNSFQGTFLGDGHTITANITNNSGQGTAPFRYINGATIKDLTVGGTIASNQRHIAGLVGFAYGTNQIEGCVVTATLDVSTDYAGGFIGHGQSSATTIEGCVFAGTINALGSNNPNVGALWGWSDSGIPTLVNCLEAGTYNNVSKMHPMGLQKAAGTITNSYYVNPQVGSPANVCTVSGAKQAYTAATAPANLGSLVEDYGMVKAYQNGILVGGTCYVAPATVTLADNADNSTAISGADGCVADVTLSDRTLYKDGKWNTLCLPFSVTLSGSPLNGAVARPLNSASISGSTLTLTFGGEVTTLVAGTPYIIKWESGDNIVNPVFNGVTIDATERNYDNGAIGDDRVRFVGTYKSTAFTAADNSILLLGGGNKLYYPTTGAGIGSCRAYFKIGDDGAAAPRLTGFSIDFGDGENNATGIIEADSSFFTLHSSFKGTWYDIQGRRIEGKPTQHGVYINNGRKVVIK